MSRQHVSISGVHFHPITQEQLIEDIAQHIQHPKKRAFLVVKPYVEFLRAAQKDPTRAELLNSADRVVADGVAIQWAASYLHGPTGAGKFVKSLLIDIQRPAWREAVIPERGAGVNSTDQLLQRAAREGWRVGILGGPRDTEHTHHALTNRYPQLKLVAVYSGYYSADEEATLAQRIASDKLDVLFVAMGFPRQEEFMMTYRDEGLAHVMLGEGGTFDFDQMGGTLKRAPQWVQQIGMEWLWRLFRQPSRVRRQAGIPGFLMAIYREGRQKSQ